MKTLATSSPEFITYLFKLGFLRVRPYAPRCKAYELRNSDGFPILRVEIHMREDKAEYACIRSLNGTRAQLLEWEINNIPAEFPLNSILGILKGAILIQIF